MSPLPGVGQGASAWGSLVTDPAETGAACKEGLGPAGTQKC